MLLQLAALALDCADFLLPLRHGLQALWQTSEPTSLDARLSDVDLKQRLSKSVERGTSAFFGRFFMIFQVFPLVFDRKRPSFTVPRPYACSSCRARLERHPNAPRCSAYAADLGFRIYGLGCRAFFAKRRNVSRGSVSTLFGTFSAPFRLDFGRGEAVSRSKRAVFLGSMLPWCCSP